MVLVEILMRQSPAVQENHHLAICRHMLLFGYFRAVASAALRVLGKTVRKKSECM